MNAAVSKIGGGSGGAAFGVRIGAVWVHKQHVPAAQRRLRGVFVTGAVVPFVGGIIAPYRPQDDLGVQRVHFLGTALRPQVAAQGGGEGLPGVAEGLKGGSFPVMRVRFRVFLPADADAVETVDDFAVRADEKLAAVQRVAERFQRVLLLLKDLAASQSRNIMPGLFSIRHALPNGIPVRSCRILLQERIHYRCIQTRSR